MQEWRLAEAKNRFTELVNKALSIGPQTVRRRNDVVVVISKAEYERLTGDKLSFKEHLLNPPHDMHDIDFKRDKSPMRSFDL